MQDLTEAYFSIYEDYDDLNEETKRTEYLQKKFNRQNKQNPGSALKYIPGKQNTGSALQKARESERHMRGDVDEGRAFSGGPDLAHKFPLSDEEKKSAQNLGFAAKAGAERRAEASETKSASKPKKKKKLEFEVRENFYDIVLDYLLDEGYADTQENAISMMSAMSEDWIDSIVEAFVDPENDEAPSGRTPMQNIEDKSDKVRKKAIKGFEKQMGKEYGGKWKYQER